MELSVFSDLDTGTQINFIQEALKGLKERCQQSEKEKIDAQNKCLDAQNKCLELQAKIDRLSNEKCSKCPILLNKINKERKEKEILKKDVKAKLLKTIALTLANLDDANTNQVNAHQLFTEMCGELVASPEQKEKITSVPLQDSEVILDGNYSKMKENIVLSERRTNVENQKSDKLKVVSGAVTKSGRAHDLLNSPEKNEKKNLIFLENNADVEDERILVNDTLMLSDSEKSSNDAHLEEDIIIIPETEVFLVNGDTNKIFVKPLKRGKGEKVLKENKLSTVDEEILQPVPKKMKCSPKHLKNLNLLQQTDLDQTSVNLGAKSPSILSGNLEDSSENKQHRVNGLGPATAGENNTVWKMRPSVLAESNSSLTGSRRRMKQMTLSLSRPEKTNKHDVSLCEGFRGGLTDHGEDDVIQPSPEQACKKTFAQKAVPCETLDDPDLTVFHPAITSTCLPVDSSFDRLPTVAKSPPYKYRRDTVRKRKERERLPGQECDECARYYEAAGLDKTQDLKARMNACSRHRDKYQIRANTPPGFWDPVIPPSPVKDSL